MGVDFADGD